MRIAAVAHDGERPDRVDLCRPLALVFGNEAQGLPADVLDRVDAGVTIPMPGRSESLNLGMAASILLYEARRQRAPGGAGVSPGVEVPAP